MELIKAYLYDYFISPVAQFFKKLKRAIAFFIIGWNNFDWDHAYLMELEVFKLKRLLYEFENFGYHSPECKNYKPKMKSLKLAIKLGEMLSEGDYFKFTGLHYKKWNRPVDLWTYKMQEDEKNEFLEAANKDDRIEAKHRRWFYNIIRDYGRYWWD